VRSAHGTIPEGTFRPARENSAYPEQRTPRASLAAHTRWADEDPAVTAARGQAGLLARFDREVREATPDLTEAEYARRAESLRKAHITRLQFASSKARKARARPATANG
jgi:hypothetical protein